MYKCMYINLDGKILGSPPTLNFLFVCKFLEILIVSDKTFHYSFLKHILKAYA